MSKWVVSVKGGPDQDAFEIAVVRQDFAHGLDSFGWFDPFYGRKILISHNGGPCRDPVPRIVWDKLVAVAYAVAMELNAERKKK